MDHSSHDTVITLWFVTATHPEKVIATMPRADRGFGRKLLSQLNPRWPITPIGQFALNRSAQPSRSEFYIAGFPGLSIIQTVVDDFTMISGIDQALRTAIPAENVYAIATNTGTSYGAFAHWSRGNLKRAFAAVNERVYEDLGLVETFESSYWAGYHTTETSGLTLPFSPIDLALHAQRSWLGFDMATCPDINIVAYAVDGRPEPKITYRQPIGARPLTERTTTKLSLGSTRSNSEFDDYELPDEFDDVDSGTKYAEEAVALTKKSVTKTKGFAARFRERLAGIGHGLKERLRHTDRPTPQPKKPAALPSAANTQPKATKEATKDKKKTDHASATEAKAAKASESSSAKQTTTKAVSTKSISTTDAIGTDAIANKSTASQDAAQGKDQQSAKTKTAQPAATAATKKPTDATDTTETIDSQAVKAGVKKAQATASASKSADKPKEAAQTAKEASVQKAESTGTKPAAAATAKPVASKTTATASAKPVTSKTAAAAADSVKPKASKAPAKTTAKATKATKTATKATKTVKKTTTKAVKRTTKATAKATTNAPETAAFPSSESATAAKPTPKSEIRVPAKSTTSAQKPVPAESPETKAFPAETSPAEDAPQKKRRTLGTRTTRSKKS